VQPLKVDHGVLRVQLWASAERAKQRTAAASAAATAELAMEGIVHGVRGRRWIMATGAACAPLVRLAGR